MPVWLIPVEFTVPDKPEEASKLFTVDTTDLNNRKVFHACIAADLLKTVVPEDAEGGGDDDWGGGGGVDLAAASLILSGSERVDAIISPVSIDEGNDVVNGLESNSGRYE